MENHRWKRLATWVCGAIGLVCFLFVTSSGSTGTGFLGVVIGLGLLGMVVYTLKTTDNWHVYDPLPSEKKIIPALTVIIGVTSVIIIIIGAYIGWKAFSSAFSNKKR